MLQHQHGQQQQQRGHWWHRRQSAQQQRSRQGVYQLAVLEQATEGDLDAVDEALEMAEDSAAETSALGRAPRWQDLAYLADELHLTFCSYLSSV